MSRLHLADRVVLVTGASSGIGAATAAALAAAGASVILCARREGALAAVAAALPHPERHCTIPLDVTDAGAVTTAITTALAHYGRIDVLVCNAGIGLTSPIADLDVELLHQVMRVNVAGTLLPIQAVLPLMRAQGGGQVVVVTSVVGQHALPYNGGYAASKAALERICEALRIEEHRHSIAVTVVRPGTVASDFFSQRLGTAGERRRRQLPGMPPETVAQAIVGAIAHPRRVVYPRLRDWWIGVLADVFPALSDRVLADQISWADDSAAAHTEPPAER
ncbi:MAG: hypothetical protein RLZZ297_1961 [Chloroflexota bacterium]